MNKDSNIYIAGATGMVGSAIVRNLKSNDYNNVLTTTRKELDLTNHLAVTEYFHKNKVDVVIDSAAKVGGIQANNIYRADFIHQNLLIQNNLFDAAFKTEVPTFLFLGSSCIYPKMADQPIKEEYLLTGPLEQTNEPYAIAKIAGLKQAEAFKKQYGLNYFSLMPTNLYGINDNFHPENSHVIPGLIRRMHEAVKNKEAVFKAWGTGKPLREFLFVDDLAEACLFMLNTKIPEKYSHINVGSKHEVSIKELVYMIADLMNFKGEIIFDRSKPDGTPRKKLDTDLINSLGWEAQTSLKEGLKKTIAFFQENILTARSY